MKFENNQKGENDVIKTCELCNEEFKAAQKTQRYCKKPHYKECPVCKKDFLLKKNRETKTCSSLCAIKYRMENKRYTLICRLCNEEFVSPVKHSKICKKEHYRNCVVCGKEYLIRNIHQPSPSCSPSCGSSLTHTKEARENRRLKSLERYGTEHPFQAEHIVKKIQESLDNSENDTRIGSKRWNEMLKTKYGVKNISQVEEIKRVKKQTYYEKYGVGNPAGMHMRNYADWDDFENFVKKVDWDCLELAKYFNVGVGAIRTVAERTNTGQYIQGFYTYTEPELKIKHILERLGFSEIDGFVHNDRTIIAPLEIDFYIKKLHTGIEVSPTYTHNSKVGWARRGEGLSVDYHYNKLSKSEEQNVNLLTAFDWTDMGELEKALINKIHFQANEESKIAYEYSYENHEWDVEFRNMLNVKDDTFKGYNHKKIVIVKNNIPVSAFIILENKKHKKAVVKHFNIDKDEDPKDIWKFFINEYKKQADLYVEKLIVTTDSSISLKEIYEDSGFKISKNIEPRLHYHQLKKDVHIKSHRYINKHKETLDNNGFLPVYDCGHIEWMMIL